MTCYSCRWSASDAALVLFCQLRDERCRQTCDEFEYEPGTDERETDCRASMHRMPASLAGWQTDAEGCDAPDRVVPRNPHDRAWIPCGCIGSASLGRSVRARSHSVVTK